MIITTKTHKAIVADKDAEIADLQERRLNAKRFLEEGREREETLRKQGYALEDENMALRARLEAAGRIQEADATRIRDLKDRCNDLWAEVAEWKARAGTFRERLIPFERTRGKGGRFVKQGDGL